ncbi:hypothetical protein Bra5_CH02808 [Rhizobium phaseoli Brasil 5]|nr:hypothetical protein Bra5_CH02808 [Rhizobium phaseoli Brasil 5]
MRRSRFGFSGRFGSLALLGSYVMVLSPLAVTRKWRNGLFVPFWSREASNIRDFRLQPARIGA